MKPHLRFEELHRLVEHFQVVRNALPVLLVAQMLVRAELDEPIRQTEFRR
jgi:hypothetical protein